MFGFTGNISIPKADYIVYTSSCERVLIIDIQWDHILDMTALGLSKLDEAATPLHMRFTEEGHPTFPAGGHKPKVASLTKKS